MSWKKKICETPWWFLNFEIFCFQFWYVHLLTQILCIKCILNKKHYCMQNVWKQNTVKTKFFDFFAKIFKAVSKCLENVATVFHHEKYVFCWHFLETWRYNFFVQLFWVLLASILSHWPPMKLMKSLILLQEPICLIRNIWKQLEKLLPDVFERLFCNVMLKKNKKKRVLMSFHTMIT